MAESRCVLADWNSECAHITSKDMMYKNTSKYDRKEHSIHYVKWSNAPS